MRDVHKKRKKSNKRKKIITNSKKKYTHKLTNGLVRPGDSERVLMCVVAEGGWACCGIMGAWGEGEGRMITIYIYQKLSLLINGDGRRESMNGKGRQIMRHILQTME